MQAYAHKRTHTNTGGGTSDLLCLLQRHHLPPRLARAGNRLTSSVALLAALTHHMLLDQRASPLASFALSTCSSGIRRG